jgi:hypothetical protein
MMLQSRLLSNQGRLLSLVEEGLPSYPSSVYHRLLPLDHIQRPKRGRLD